MMVNPVKTDQKNSFRLLAGFICCWVLLNSLQALFTGIYPDEAYYWVYSLNLQWGYFDHPPVVALGIKIGELLGHNGFFTRLGTILFSAGSVFFLWKAIPPKLVDTKSFLIIFLSVIPFHVYGFIATPDGALFFFTAMFFFAYRLYLRQESFRNCFFITVAIIGMLYSKYHAVLPLALVFFSNPKLIFKTSSWAVVFIVVLALSPHIYWQYTHGWPTIYYHLSDRIGSQYRISKTLYYLLGQLLMWGPLATIPVFYKFIKPSTSDLYLKAHRYTFWGVLIFFLLNSFRSSIEMHWTLVAGVSFVVLLMQALQNTSATFRNTIFKLAFLNIFLVLVLRVFLIIPGSPLSRASNFKSMFYGKALLDGVYKYAGDTPVVFIDSYALPSLYKYYHPNVQTIGYNTINYRRNHFTISNDEILLNNKKAFVELDHKIDNSDVFVTSPYTNIYLHPIDSFKAVNALKIQWLNPEKKGKPGEEKQALLSITNTSNERIVADTSLGLTYTFFKTRKNKQTSRNKLLGWQFEPGQKINASLNLKMPEQRGNYRLIFSFEYYPFQGTLASDYFDVRIE